MTMKAQKNKEKSVRDYDDILIKKRTANSFLPELRY